MMMRFMVCVVATLVAWLGVRAAAAGDARTCDRPHIQAHLSVVLSELRTADVSHLSRAQRRARARQIERLDAYRETCIFPQNDVLPDRITPVFVDAQGTHCAVGHLLSLDGRTGLVEQIRNSRNTASIWELAENPDLQRWLNVSGVSLYEAARIQPAYCSQNSDCLCRGGREADGGVLLGQINALNDRETSNLNEGRMVVTEVYGQSEYLVGDVVMIGTDSDDYIGRAVIAPVRNGRVARHSYQVVGAETVSCNTHFPDGETNRAEVPIETYVEALLAEDCAQALTEYDPALAERRCSEGGDVSCSNMGANHTPWAAFVSAVLAGMLLIRTRKRTSLS